MNAPGHDPQAMIDADHHVLVRQIEKMARLCTRAPEDSCCTRCPAATFDACETALFDVTGKMLVLMLEHFEREDELMRQLPRIPAVLRHCEAHRDAHVEFSARYNNLVMGWRPDDLAGSIRGWVSFVSDWLHGHARRFDAELTRLASGGDREPARRGA